jgi:hypothetical protein
MRWKRRLQYLLKTWSTPTVIPEEVHNEDMLLEESRKGAGDASCS